MENIGDLLHGGQNSDIYSGKNSDQYSGLLNALENGARMPKDKEDYILGFMHALELGYGLDPYKSLFKDKTSGSLTDGSFLPMDYGRNNLLGNNHYGLGNHGATYEIIIRGNIPDLSLANNDDKGSRYFGEVIKQITGYGSKDSGSSDK